jgi:hypothetical protein
MNKIKLVNFSPHTINLLNSETVKQYSVSQKLHFKNYLDEL